MKYLGLLEDKSFAEKLVKETGKILLDHRDNFRVVNQKDTRDVATTADIASEKFIIARLQEKYPDFSIFSEEAGKINKNSVFEWLIDPLDGTKAFVRGLTNYSCNICLTQNSEPIVTACYYPEFDRLYSACKGGGVFINGQKTSLSKVNELSNAYVYFYLPTRNRKVINYEQSWEKIKLVADKAYRVSSEASVALSAAFVANGACEAFVNLSNPSHWHDLAPALLIGKESGAIVDTKNFPLLVANNKKIYNQLLGILK